MKKMIRLFSSCILLAFCLTANSQVQGHFNFVIQDVDGRPLTNAKLIVLSGEEYFSDNQGKITYYGEEDYIKKDGKYVKTRVLPLYITAKAKYYKDQTIELSKYKIGSTITVRLQKLPVEYQKINVFVKDKQGQPISGAYILVNPGRSTSSDEFGMAQAEHTQMIGEWVMIRVSAEGFKTQTQHIPTGDATRMENGKVIPPATAYFVMERGTNESTIFHINVEVLDEESDQPIPGAQVKLNISDGTVQEGSTNASGEALFSDLEYSYKGTTARVMVSKTGYKENWSDITSDLMTGKDNPTRQYLVYLKKETTACWPGSYAAFDQQTQRTLCYCNPGLVWNDTKTACVDPKELVKGCVGKDAETFSKIVGSWKGYRMHVTIGGSCDNITGTWKVTEWCEGVDETYNASVARVNGTITGKMQNGYIQLKVVAPPSPNNKNGTNTSGSVSLNANGTLYASFGCPGELKKQ